MLQPIRYLLDRSLCFRPERELAGSDFHRRIKRALQGTHNNSAERSIRPVVLGRRNYLFAGSDAGGERAACIYSLIGTALLNGHDPYLYLHQVLERIAEHPINRIDALLPWRMTLEMPARRCA